MAADSGASLQTVEKAIEVLQDVVAATEPVGVTEVARRLGINPSTTYRILNTFKAYNLVEQEEQTARYRPAIGLLRLCGPALASFDLRRLARPILEALAEQTGESVNLMVPDGNYGLYVDSVESRQNIRMVVRIGAQEHLHRSAVGKAILAHLPAAKREAVLDAAGLARATEQTIVDRDALLRHLAEVRARGWALDDEEGEAGTRCCGAPIFDGEGKVLGALSVAGPAFRLPLERLAALAPSVKATAARVSACFGYRG